MNDKTEIARAVRVGLTTVQPGIQVSDDPNLPFTPPSDIAYATVRFVEGAEVQASMAGRQSIWRSPLLVYVDVRGPQGRGDGEVDALARAARDALFRLVVGSTRWRRWEQGPEGKDGTDYRKQVVGVFQRERRA